MMPPPTTPRSPSAPPVLDPAEDRTGFAAFITYGCRLNQYDTQAIREEVLGLGYEETDRDRDLDLIVVNSCTVTQRSGDKVESKVRSLSSRNPGATILVTGCLTDEDRTRLATIPGVEHLIGNEEKDLIPQIIEGHARTGVRKTRRNDRSIFDLGVSAFRGHTRAFIKVQDGCDSFCTYCIIPYLRGASRSRSREDVLAEAGRLAEAGHREVVLTGIHLREYGRDLGLEQGLIRLLADLRSLEGIDRVRLSSIGERTFTPEFLALFRGDPGLCPSFHIPLQSGSRTVLERMGRDYTRQEYLESLERIREALPHATITTDLMIGFPGETEAEFEESLETCREARFLHTHIFPYSPRPRTKAARLPDHVSQKVKGERVARAREVAEAAALAERTSRIGEPVHVLLERRREGTWSGLSREGLRVFVKSEQDLGRGTEISAVVTGVASQGVDARLAADREEFDRSERDRV